MDKVLEYEEINSIIKSVYEQSIDSIIASNKNLSIREMLEKVQNTVNDEIRKRSNGECSIGNLRLKDIRIDKINRVLEKESAKDKYELDFKNKLESKMMNESNSESNSASDTDKDNEDSDSNNSDNMESGDYKITFKKYLEDVEVVDDLKSMFIGMLLDLKERMKGCEQCETCSEVISIVESYIKEYKKTSKLATQLANLFILLVENRVPKVLSASQKKILDLAFIMIIKNSKFVDVEYIYECFKDNLNINVFNGLGIRLSVQKYGNENIKKLISWGADITVNEHRPIVRAFHYEEFKIVKTLIKHGSSYKYYLKGELEDNEFEFVYKKFEDMLDKELPTGSVKDREYKFIEWVKEYAAIRKNITNKEEQVADVIFIYDFINVFSYFSFLLLDSLR